MIKQIKAHFYRDGWVEYSELREYYVIFPSKVDDFESLLDAERITDIKEDSRVYFAPCVKFPRVKFREWVSTREVQITRTLPYADCCVIDLKEMEEVLATIRGSAQQPLCIMDNGEVVLFYTEKSKEKYMELEGVPKIKKSSKPYVLYQKSRTQYVSEIVSSSFLIRDMGIPIIDVNDMVNSTNNSEVIDATRIDDLVDMIKSSEYLEIGKEILYNCNYSKSLFFIALIMARCHKELEWGNTSVNRTSFYNYTDTVGITSNGQPYVKGTDLQAIRGLLMMFYEINAYHLVDQEYIRNIVNEQIREKIEGLNFGEGIELRDYHINMDALVSMDSLREFHFLKATG